MTPTPEQEEEFEHICATVILEFNEAITRICARLDHEKKSPHLTMLALYVTVGTLYEKYIKIIKGGPDLLDSRYKELSPTQVKTAQERLDYVKQMLELH